VSDELGEVAAGETGVFERDVALTVVDAAVASVRDVEERLDAARSGLRDVCGDLRNDAVERRAARLERFRGGLGMHAARVLIGPREEVRPGTEQAKEVEVARGVVVGVAERRELRVDRDVGADDDREGGGGLAWLVGARGRRGRTQRGEHGDDERGDGTAAVLGARVQTTEALARAGHVTASR